MAKTAFEAFEPSVVVDEFARKIDSLCVWNDTLIAGLSDGSLLFFNEESADGSTGTRISTWQVTRVQKNFCKRSILQLQTLDNQQHLLSLSDEGVQLHSLPELQLTSAASRTSRAGAFSWDDRRRLLVTAIKRKVVSHQLDTNNMFLEMTEYNIPEPVIALSWVGSSIVLATAKSYWLIVPAPSQSVEVLPGQVMTIYPAVQPQLLFAAGANSRPVMTRLPSGEVLITKDAVSYFLGSDGKPSRKTAITWSQPPTALMATKLYVIAVLPAAIEVKSVSRLGAAAAEQMLLLPGMAVTAPTPAPDGSMYLASATDGGIRQLKPVPLERQAKLLAAAGDFQGALELLTLLEDEESTREAAAAAAGDGAAVGGGSAASRRQQLEDVLRLRFGYHLFEAGESDEALTQLSMCSDPDPLLLLRLYPSLVPDKFRALLPTSAYGESLPDISHTSSRDSADVGDKSAEPVDSSAVFAAVSRGETRQQNGSASGATPAAAAADAAALAVVVPYLLSHRTRLLSQMEDAAAAGGDDDSLRDEQHEQQVLNHRSSSASSTSPSSLTAANGSNDSSKVKSHEQLQLIAAVIDTAILRAMLMQSDSGALLRLLQQVNFVDVEDGEAVLSAAGRYAELAALYQYNRRHDQGLGLLQQLSQHPGSLQVPPRGAAADLRGLPGVWAAVRYLTAMQPQDIKLIKEHAGWILECDPEAGLEALLAMNPPLSTQLVKPLLEAHAPSFTAVYLESALDLGLATPREVHSELLLIYLHMALEEEREGEKSSEAHARQLSLSDLLVSRPHQPLKLFPDDPSLWGAPTPRTSQAGAPSAGTSSDTQATTPSDTGAGEEGTAGDTAARPATVQQPSRTVSPAPSATVQLHTPTRRDAYQRLRELVYSSDFIDPEYVLSKLGQGQLLEIRALMLERLGRHREALSVYIHDLKAIDLAEQYCDRVYEAGIEAVTGRSPALGPGVVPGGPEGTSGDTAAGAGNTAAAAAAEDSAGPAAVEPATSIGSGPMVPGSQNPTGTGTRRGLAGTSVSAGSTWGKVQRQQQKQKQGKQQPRGRQQPPVGRRMWPALAFGVQPQDIYMELVDAVLQGPSKAHGPSDGAPPKVQQRQQAASPAAVDHEAWKQLSQLLSRKTSRINHLQVLGVLPDQLPLSDVSALLSGMLVYDTEQKRNLSVVQHLRRAENLMAREDLVKVKQRVVTLTFERACCICHKRMGGAVSVAYPNGTLAHYLCYKRSTGQQPGQPLWDGTAAVGPAGENADAAATQQQPVVGTEAWLRQSLAVQQQQHRSSDGGWGSMVSAVAH